MANNLSTWAAGQGNVLTAVINSLRIKIASDDAYYHLGNPKGAKATLTPDADADDRGRPWMAGQLLEISYPSLQASSVEIGVLDDIATYQRAAIVAALGDGCYLDSVGVTATEAQKLGIGWRMTCDQKFRMIEYMLRVMLRRDEIDSLWVASNGTPTAAGTPNATDKLYTLASGADNTKGIIADQKPGGIAKIEWSTDGSSFSDVGDFSNAKLVIETVMKDGGGGRMKYSVPGIKFSFNADLHETSTTQVELFDTFAASEISLKITFMDAVVLTITSTNINGTIGLDASGGANEIRKAKLFAEGIMPNFASTGVWAALWS